MFEVSSRGEKNSFCEIERKGVEVLETLALQGTRKQRLKMMSSFSGWRESGVKMSEGRFQGEAKEVRLIRFGRESGWRTLR